jgi:uncharacterized lipoprotein YajG
VAGINIINHKQIKKFKMKKLLLVLAIGAFAACNDSATSTESTTDSSANVTADSLQNRGDSVSTSVDSTTNAKVDSVQNKKDSTKH